MNHKKADYLRLMNGAVREPTLVTLRITNDREGRSDAPAVWSRALQSKVGEPRVPPNVVPSMFIFLFFMPCYKFKYLCFWIMCLYV